MSRSVLHRAGLAGLTLAALAPAAPGPAVAGWTNDTLYRFANANVGDQPQGGVIRDASGALYGTTVLGGYPLSGTVFRVSAAGKTTVLHTFCTVYDTAGNCADGQWPTSGLVMDASGALYGTAEYGGPQNLGTVWKLVPGTGGAGWRFVKLHDFAGPDGGNVLAGLAIDGNGALYGTTAADGAHGYGSLFRLAPAAGTASGYAFQVLHQFTGGKDGGSPYAGVTVDGAGNLYGTTYIGALGPCGSTTVPTCGVVYRLSPPAPGKSGWADTVLYSFAPDPKGGFAAGGVNPAAAPILGPGGVLYGTASLGGAGNAGVIYQLTPPASGKGAWTETVLRSFTDAVEGDFPAGGVTLSGTSLYGGTVSGGGATACGAIFELAPPLAPKTAWTVTVLHQFADGKDGCGASGSPVLDGSGAIYGMTTGYDQSLEGGGITPGTVFKLTP